MSRVNVKRIKPKEEGNANWPLPHDYADLSQEGQRLARVNACRLWIAPGLSKDVLGHTFIGCLTFFDDYYLHPDEDEEHDPQFYMEDPLPTPIFHKLLAYQSITEWTCTATCPRGSGKTAEIRKEILLQISTLPGFWVVYCTSTQDNMIDTGEACRLQFLFNKRLHDDFAPEYGGRLLPKKGQGSNANQRFRLTNGAIFRGLSAKSRIRSIRPSIFYLDDPEFDETASTPMSQIRLYMEKLIKKVALPAVAKAGARLVWRNTFITKRHYAYVAMEGKEVNGQFVSEDPNFNFWHRMRIVAEVVGKDGKLKSIWPEMWPLTYAEKLEMAKVNPRYLKSHSLEEMKARMGVANYNAEMLAKPGEADTAYFSYNPASQGEHSYWLEEADQYFETEPRISNTRICWQEKKGDGTTETKRMMVHEFLARPGHIIFQTGDTSTTSGVSSDYKATVVMLVNPNNDLFILDLWAKKGPEPLLTLATFKLADKWKVPTIHAEAIREGVSYYQALLAIVGQRARELVQTKHLPRVHKVIRGHAEKSAFISGLKFRFDHGKIKLPMWRRAEPMWDLLFGQIEDFNPDIENGGLQHDDLLDDVAMSNPVIHHRTRELTGPVIDARTPLDRLKAGETHDPVTKMPYAIAVDWLKTPVEDVMQVLAQHDQRSPDPHQESVI